MIDTVVLILNRNMFHISNPDLFTPSARWIFNQQFMVGGRSNFASKQNPTSIDMKLGKYKPRLTLTKRFYDRVPQITLKIEFSAPKMLFRNNFDELVENDFDGLISNLLERLEEMGVKSSIPSLKSSLVSTIHYSKNIALTNGLTPFTVLKEIQKANISQRLDFNQTDFRNGGHSIKFRANSFEITFYDKIKDMQMSKISDKRAIEADNAIQLSLFEQLEDFQKNRPLEVVRMEIRLNQRQKIMSVLKTLDVTVEPTFQNLFKLEIAKNVLLYYLDIIEDSYPKSLNFESKSTKDFLSTFVIDNTDRKLQDAVIAYGFNRILNELTTREIRELFKRTKKHSWYRFIRQMNSYNYSKKHQSLLEPIRDAICDYIPLKSNNYKLGKDL